MLDATWLPYRRAQPQPALRLFCFPHSGGAASLFRTWQAQLPPSIEVCAVQLPGRERRFAEPPRSDLRALVNELADAWQPSPVPFACIGVSMGAWLQFELARELRRRGKPGPQLLVVVAMLAPHIPDPDGEQEHALSLDAWIALARSRGELTDEEAAGRELLEMLHPMLKADAALTETHTYVEEPPLACPISAYAMTRDQRVDPDEVQQWNQHTTGAFTFALLEGEHNVLKTAPGVILEPLRRDLAPWIGGRP